VTTKKACYKLKVACEAAKRNLHTNNEASIDVDALFDGKDFTSKISNTRFLGINQELFNKLEPPILKALEDADLKANAITGIVLVGGSSRLKYVDRLIAKLFPGIEINKNINPDEAVAYGAAILAAHLNGDTHESLRAFNLKDVTPLSLGIEVVGGQMEILIERNSQTPIQVTKIFTTNFDNQAAVSIVVYEGERPLVKDNNKLGEFVINGISPARREVPKIEVTFEIDKDGILSVSAVDKRSGETKTKVVIQNDTGRLAEPEIRRMIQDAIKFKEDDEKEHQRVRAKVALEDYCLETKSRIHNTNTPITQKEKDNVHKNCDECLDWLADNEDEEYDKLIKKLEDLQTKCNSTLSKC